MEIAALPSALKTVNVTMGGQIFANVPVEDGAMTPQLPTDQLTSGDPGAIVLGTGWPTPATKNLGGSQGQPLPSLAAMIGTVTMALLVTGCSGSSDAKKSTQPTTSSKSATAAPTGKDLSAQVLNYQRPAEIAKVTTTGKPFFTTPITIHVTGLKTDAHSTILTYFITGEFGSQFLDWENFPVLTDPATKNVYAVNTYGVPNDITHQIVQRCACSLPRSSTNPAGGSMNTAQFPPLPASVTKVELTSRYFPSTAVPVSR